MYPEYSIEYHKGMVYLNKANTCSPLKPNAKLSYLETALKYFELSVKSTTPLIKSMSDLKIELIKKQIKELETARNSGTTC